MVDRKPQPDERLILRDPWWVSWAIIAAAAVIILIALFVSGVIG
jgi:hypothetical protein